MSLIFDVKLDKGFSIGHIGQVLGGLDINGRPIKVGDRIKFRFEKGILEGHVFYDKKNFRYVIETTSYAHVYDFEGVYDIEVIGKYFERSAVRTIKAEDIKETDLHNKIMNFITNLYPEFQFEPNNEETRFKINEQLIYDISGALADHGHTNISEYVNVTVRMSEENENDVDILPDNFVTALIMEGYLPATIPQSEDKVFNDNRVITWNSEIKGLEINDMINFL